jgi:predicted aspartyl protease
MSNLFVNTSNGYKNKEALIDTGADVYSVWEGLLGK